MGTPMESTSFEAAGHAQAVGSRARRRNELYATPRRDRSLRFVVAACTAALAAGWFVREEFWIRAEEGVGYALGIVGLSCMVVLLSYSVRKRALFLHGWAPIRWWFQTHMALGLIGPSAILLHANFELGSLNARIALSSMALVVASGIVGRVLYARVHRGLFGRRREFEPLLREAREGFGAVDSILERIPALREDFARFEQRATESPRTALGGLWRFLTIGCVRGRLAARSVRALARAPSTPGAGSKAELIEWLDRAAELARFRGYERLLSIWHGVHLPLCILLFGTAAAHVLAVHMY